MIIPLPVIGLALASRIPLAKKGAPAFKTRKSPKTKRYVQPSGKKRIKPLSLPDSLRGLANSLSSTLSGLTGKKPAEDYDAVVKNFLPPGAVQLAPQYPVKIGRYILADLDGDMQKELVTTYRHNDTSSIIVLKKQKDKWQKAAEAVNSQYDTINFMGAADVTGDKKEQLLIGWRSKEGFGELHGYSLKDGALDEVFTHQYNYMEVLNPSSDQRNSSQAQLALWNRKGNDSYDIVLKHWNGSELEPDTNQADYFYRRVLPYYGKAVKKLPQNPTSWFNLANALEKAGMYRDALQSIEIGLAQNPSPQLREEFKALNEKVIPKLKV